MGSSVVDIIFSAEQDTVVIPHSSRSVHQLLYYGPMENTVQPSFQREQQYVGHPMQLGSNGSFDRFHVPEC